jgi:hypothetical protein
MPPLSTAGSQKARDIALIYAAYRGTAGWDNTWKILHRFNEVAKWSPSNFSTFERTWDDIFGKEAQKPAFEREQSKTDFWSPLSPKLSQESVLLFNKAIERMVFFETNENWASAMLLESKFTNYLGKVGDMRYLQTTFLSHAFGMSHTETTRVFEFAGDDFLAAWAELEIDNRYNKPVFPLIEGWIDPASPLVTGVWSLESQD